MFRLIYLTILTLLFLVSCNSAKRHLRLGDKRFKKGEFDFAAENYKNAIAKGANSGDVYFKVAESYRRSNRLIEAGPFYKQAIDAGVKKDTALFFQAVYLKNLGEYENAKGAFNQYLKVGSTTDFIRKAKREVAFLENVRALLLKDVPFKVKNATSINTEFSEFSPAKYKDHVVFASDRGMDITYRATGNGFYSLYEFKPDNFAEGTGALTLFDKTIEEEGVHSACATFTKDGKTMVFAKSNNGSKKGNNGGTIQETDLYVSNYIEGKWSVPTIISASLPTAWESTPCFSADDKILYFSSNRSGGYGGIDIYRCAVLDNNKFGTAYNLGSKINTSGNEMFPFVSGDSKLYFASDGHAGLGSLDVFIASKDTSRNITIENLGYPINSSYDDFGLSFISPEVGYFCSDRPGGKGNDDIYYFAFSPDARKKVEYNLVVYTQKNNETGNDIPLEGVTVKMLNEKDSIIHEFTSKTEGKMVLPVQTEKNYSFVATKKGFFTKRQTFSTVGRTVPQFQLKDSLNVITFETDLDLDSIILEKEIVLDNIYYDYNKADIRTDAAKELDKLVGILKDNPEISIELGSHTDSRGNNDYNLKLSQRRAESAVNYMVSKEISAEWVTAIGYGEEKHLVEDATTEEEHQMNRRTEFKVVKIGKR
ncbi:MAG: OmpA family protein [Opitutaceae bacterium]|nr:OmpA family protein [Cytophagales bacterium]